MKCYIKHEVIWLESLCVADNVATILLLGGDRHLVPVPASLLLAVSPLVRSILAEHLPPEFSQCCISLPSVTEDLLIVFRDLLSTGEVADGHVKSKKEVRHVFDMLGVNALLASCHSESISVGQVLDVKVENVADEAVKVETLPTEIEYWENVTPKDHTNLLTFSNIVNSSVFQDSDDVTVSSDFEIKVELDSVQIIKEVPHKCRECKYACYDKKELKIHIQTSHGCERKKFYCQNCLYSCSAMSGLEYHCATTGHKACRDAEVCKECDFIASNKDELFKHKKKVHIPAWQLFECGDCSWVDKQIGTLRRHAHSRDHTTKHDYEAAALAKAEALGSKAVAKYHKSLSNSIKRLRKNH